MNEARKSSDPAKPAGMSGPDVLEIRIGPDGRVYFTGLPPEFLEIAAELCPDDPELAKRMEILKKARRLRSRESDKEKRGG